MPQPDQTICLPDPARPLPASGPRHSAPGHADGNRRHAKGDAGHARGDDRHATIPGAAMRMAVPATRVAPPATRVAAIAIRKAAPAMPFPGPCHPHGDGCHPHGDSRHSHGPCRHSPFFHHLPHACTLPTNHVTTINRIFSVKQPNSQTAKPMSLNTHNTTHNTAPLLAALLITAGSATAWSADAGTDYLNDASLMVTVTGGPESRTHTGEDPGKGTYGAVDYNYAIGKYEVTNAQYAAFLNTIGVTSTNDDLNRNLYNPTQASYGLTWNNDASQFVGDNRPVTYVNFYDAARFVNWLTNGGTATSDTETGMYKLSDGLGITRNAGAWEAGGFAIANENEWFRAAYYDPVKEDDGTGGFWDYATQSNDYSGSLEAANGQNYRNGGHGNVALEVGSFIHATSFFGTYDQGGNVWELCEDITVATSRVVVRGGGITAIYSYLDYVYGRNATTMTDESGGIGFRVVSLTTVPVAVPVPEPGAVAAATGAVVLVIGVWLRRGRRTGRG
ncbi:MAG: SUMF1/EgtB/PvdO family nonheme iron enzyme [Opitutaceae bacterium]|jgi:formylglycine-generating enzyme required for sulfatase activity|nr:SUMF1/EgtB/PvdO family nonheme iron enzyme [Opitutaceae bacterium]